jgi:hypothetical protein
MCVHVSLFTVSCPPAVFLTLPCLCSLCYGMSAMCSSVSVCDKCFSVAKLMGNAVFPETRPERKRRKRMGNATTKLKRKRYPKSVAWGYVRCYRKRYHAGRKRARLETRRADQLRTAVNSPQQPPTNPNSSQPTPEPPGPPAKPALHMPLPLSTTSAATSSSPMAKNTRPEFTGVNNFGLSCRGGYSHLEQRNDRHHVHKPL